MVNYLNALRVTGVAIDPKSWATKHAAAATIGLIIPVVVAFLPPQYATYFNQDFANSVGLVLATLAGLFGVFGATDKVGLLPAPKSEPSDIGKNDLSGGA